MTSFTPITDRDLPELLPVLLAPPGGRRLGDKTAVRGFLEYARQPGLQCTGLFSGPPQRPTGVFLALLLPGRTAIAITPAPGEHGIDAGVQADLSRAALEQLRQRQLYYLQALVEPESASRHALLQELGFSRLTRLLYLERDASYPWLNPPRTEGVQWIPYDQARRPDFAAALLATYEGSRDCPALHGLRPIDEVLASHRAAGEFDPALWELVQIDGATAGCLLLARLPHAGLMEVVYMGVVTEFRQRGVGMLLLRRALQQCRRLREPRITLVVDEQNEPAQRLYSRCGFAQVAARDAYLRRDA